MHTYTVTFIKHDGVILPRRAPSAQNAHILTRIHTHIQIQRPVTFVKLDGINPVQRALPAQNAHNMHTYTRAYIHTYIHTDTKASHFREA